MARDNWINWAAIDRSIQSLTIISIVGMALHKTHGTYPILNFKLDRITSTAATAATTTTTTMTTTTARVGLASQPNPKQAPSFQNSFEPLSSIFKNRIKIKSMIGLNWSTPSQTSQTWQTGLFVLNLFWDFAHCSWPLWVCLISENLYFLQNRISPMKFLTAIRNIKFLLYT